MTRMNPTENSELLVFTSSGGVSTGALVYTMNENTLMLILSLAGLIVSVIGLIYTIWKGERTYRLAYMEFQETHKRRSAEDEHTRES